MKTIYLLRHAKAADADQGIPDFERTLVKSGKSGAQKIAKKFANKAKPKLIISSPAKRAVETAAIFAKQLGVSKKKIELNQIIYESGQQAFLEIVTGVDDKTKSILLVGHSPSLDQFASSLVRDFKGPLPISAIVGIKFNVESWKNVEGGRGELAYFDHPNLKKERQEKYKEFRKGLESKIIASATTTLKRIDMPSAEKISKEIQNASKNIVASFAKAVKKSNPNRIYDNKIASRKRGGQSVTKSIETKTTEQAQEQEHHEK